MGHSARAVTHTPISSKATCTGTNNRRIHDNVSSDPPAAGERRQNRSPVATASQMNSAPHPACSGWNSMLNASPSGNSNPARKRRSEGRKRFSMGPILSLDNRSMNPLLDKLQPYPFERLRQLFAGITPD